MHLRTMADHVHILFSAPPQYSIVMMTSYGQLSRWS